MSLKRELLWRYASIMMLVIFGVMGDVCAQTDLYGRGTIRATATVGVAIGLASSCDTCLTSAPSAPSSTAVQPAIPLESDWILRIGSVNGTLLNVNGEECDISRLSTTESSFARMLDLRSFIPKVSSPDDSLVITLIRFDD